MTALSPLICHIFPATFNIASDYNSIVFQHATVNPHTELLYMHKLFILVSTVASLSSNMTALLFLLSLL